MIAQCDIVDATRHRRDDRSARVAMQSPEGGGAQACEHRAPAMHTATRSFPEERVKAEFLFDFASPNAYIAHTRIRGTESRTSVTVEPVPVPLRGVFKVVANVSRP